MSIENIETYINQNGYPIIRRCKNCMYWKTETDESKSGYCIQRPFYFAFILEPNVYAVTKDFFLCENHKFINEAKLSIVSEKVLMKEILKKKDEIE